MRLLLTILLPITCYCCHGQTLGGSTVYNFLKLPVTPQLAALGGVNVSRTGGDIGLASNSPALLFPQHHGQLHASFNSLFDGIKAFHVSGGYHHSKLNTTFAAGLTYFDYGSTQQTDASGNTLGMFRPTDWSFQLSASRSYLEKWRYGLAVKLIRSQYGPYRSTGIASDVSVLYLDSANGLSASFLAKNMGSTLTSYATGPDDLPFDLQAGITKRFAGSPFAVSFTAHHLHRFDITYNDETFNNQNGFDNEKRGFTFDKLFRHFVIANSIHLGNHVIIDAGYNYLRRKELSISGSGNGLTGFSFGAALITQRLQVRYARAQYQNGWATNQFGVNVVFSR